MQTTLVIAEYVRCVSDCKLYACWIFIKKEGLPVVTSVNDLQDMLLSSLNVFKASLYSSDLVHTSRTLRALTEGKSLTHENTAVSYSG